MSEVKAQATPNTEPIPVKDAIRLCDLGIEDCDNATQGPWEHSEERVYGVCDFDYSDDGAFIVLSRAVMRPMLSGLLSDVKWGAAYFSRFDPEMGIYPPLAAMRSHYDLVRPGWRTK